MTCPDCGARRQGETCHVCGWEYGDPATFVTLRRMEVIEEEREGPFSSKIAAYNWVRRRARAHRHAGHPTKRPYLSAEYETRDA